MNIKPIKPDKQLADYLKVMGSPFRIRILFTIGLGEACVCHLEAALKRRQAYISQHLMVLRDAGILETRRDGKYIFYRIADPDLFSLISSAAGLLNIPQDSLPAIQQTSKAAGCECPHCQE